jgi:hypothetical protein
MDSRIAAAVFAAGLTMAAQVSAQQALQPAPWRNVLTPLPATNEPARDAFVAPYARLPGAKIDEPAPTIATRSFASSPIATPFPGNVWTAPRDTLQLEGAFKTQSSAEAFAKRLPFYVAAPYWLPRSRPFPNSSHPTLTVSPAASKGLANDVAGLIWPGSAE